MAKIGKENSIGITKIYTSDGREVKLMSSNAATYGDKTGTEQLNKIKSDLSDLDEEQAEMAKQLGALADKLDDAASKAKVADDLNDIKNDIRKIRDTVTVLTRAMGEASLKMSNLESRINRLEYQQNTTTGTYFTTPPTLTC